MINGKPHLLEVTATSPTHTTIATQCPWCNKVTKHRFPTDAISSWLNGTLIQRALPSATTDEREALMTGICPPCWNKMAGPTDDTGDEDAGMTDERIKAEANEDGDPATWDKAEDSHIDQSESRE